MLVALYCIAMVWLIWLLMTPEQTLEEKAGCIVWGTGWSLFCKVDKDE